MFKIATRFKVLIAGVLLMATPAAAQNAIDRIETGLLECRGAGGTGLILGSRKTMRCVVTSLSGQSLGTYEATITKFGLDIGTTSNTQLVWTIFAPASASGDNFEVGSLDGNYAGIGAEATAGVGLGANALIGGGRNSIALQPLSAQAQTGLNLAVGVQTLQLRFTGPAIREGEDGSAAGTLPAQ